MLSPEYVAGIFDGEDCANFARCRGNIHPCVMVTNTNLDLLHALQATYGGDVQPLSKRKSNWKACYVWRLTWSKAIEFLDSIADFLIVKDQQAATIFAWDAVRGGRGVKQDASINELLVRRMHWLNSRGPRIGPDPIDEVLCAAD